MDATQALKDANYTLTIRQHCNNCRHCFNVDGTTMELVEWATGQGFTLENTASFLNSQAWELVPACDMEDAISEGWVVCILHHFTCANIYLVRTC